jgi:hypothetical protein
LEQIERTKKEAEDVPGRLGNDCLAFQLKENGMVKRSLFCEAKCSAKHSSNLISTGLGQLNGKRLIPESIWQISEILRDREGNDEILNALLKLGLEGPDGDYERCNLLSYVYGQQLVNKLTWIEPTGPHERYKGRRRLEAVEISLQGICDDPGRNLLDELVEEVHCELQEQEEEDVQLQYSAQPSSQVKDVASNILRERAESFPRRFAKLYSQHKRLREGQRGLTGWQPNEASERLDEAVQLLQAAFIAREADKSSPWRKGMQRAGEILEWLAHPELNTSQLPVRLLSSAVY